MPSVISYRKFINEQITREVSLPTDASGQRLGQEIATLDGITYVSLPDNAKLPADQPAEIAASIKPVAMNATLRQQLADASPRVLFIRNRVAAKIAARYSITDEIKLLRTAPSAEFENYNTFAEECRAEGRAMRAELGL